MDGPKVRIFVEWARLLHAAGPPSSGPPFSEAIESLGRHEARLVATGNEVWFIEAARAEALLGAVDLGIDWLKRAVEAGYSSLEWIPNDPEMASLAANPRFGSLEGPSPSR